jgi:DNA-binding response OmpR family regulator
VRILVDVANGRVDSALIETLERAGHVVERGHASVAASRFDVVIVGTVELADRLTREQPGRAVIVFTRLGDVEARIRALAAGAADAVDAGFARSQIAARVGAAGRRAALLPRSAEVIEIDECTIDLTACTCARDGAEVELTRREVELVRWLARRAGQVVARADLLEHVWGVSARTETRAIDVAIAALRQKIERDPAEPAILVTVKGVGYRWG